MCTPSRYDWMEQLGKQSVSCLSVSLSLLACFLFYNGRLSSRVGQSFIVFTDHFDCL